MTVKYIKSSTTPTNDTPSPFGPEWSLAGVEHLWFAQGGVILQNPDGTSLWYSGDTTNGFARPAYWVFASGVVIHFKKQSSRFRLICHFRRYRTASGTGFAF